MDFHMVAIWFCRWLKPRPRRGITSELAQPPMASRTASLGLENPMGKPVKKMGYHIKMLTKPPCYTGNLWEIYGMIIG